MTSTPETRAIAAAVDEIKPLLAGRSPAEQGAILADLAAIWLASHVVRGDAAATRRMRAAVLELHIAMVRQLIEINAKILGTDQ